MVSTIIGFISPAFPKPTSSTCRNFLCTKFRSLDFKRHRVREHRIKTECLQFLDQAILSVDIGTSTIKCAPYFVPSNVLGPKKERSIRTFCTGENGTQVTQNVDEWYQGVIAVIRDVILSHPKIEVLAISVTGQMQDLITVGKKTPCFLGESAILYSDRRASVEAERLSEILNVSVQSTSLLAKLSFLQTIYHKDKSRTVSENPFSAQLLFGAADYITYALSETPKAIVTDATTVSTTSLSIAPKHRKYNYDVLVLCGLGDFIESLPRILDKPEVVGKLSIQAATEIGCQELQGIDIIHAGGDAFTTTVGGGCILSGKQSYVYAGTTGWIGATVPWKSLPTNKSDGVFLLGHALDDSLNISVASVVSVGGSLSAYSKLLLKCNVEKLDAIAEKSDIGSNGLIFVPYINGRRCPNPTDCTTGGFYGMRVNTSQEHIARALIEGVVFSIVEAGTELVSPYDIDPPKVLTGGVSRSQIFCEGIAALCGEGAIYKGDTDAGLIGAGEVAAAEKNLTNNDPTIRASDTMSNIEHSKIIVHEKDCHRWHQSYLRWREIVQSFETLWQKDHRIDWEGKGQ